MPLCRASIALELRFNPIHGGTIAVGALNAVAELRERFDRGFVFFEVEARDKLRDRVVFWNELTGGQRGPLLACHECRGYQKASHH
jgi:hypothetical protein